MHQSNETLSSASFYNRLDPICQAGLATSLNPNSNAFDLQLMDKNWHSCSEFYPTEALTSTAICLIGISRSELDPSLLGMSPQKSLDAAYDLIRKTKYRGGFGLVLWANAVNNGLDLDTLQFRCGVSLDKFNKLLASLTTMEAAWLVSGLAHEYKRSGGDDTLQLLNQGVDELINKRFQPATSTVCHAGAKPSASHALRRWIANFADQVYTIQALAFAAKVSQNTAALEVAEKIADKMVELQGDKGQWWWHYDARKGTVPQGYSVYSVHQHGMAPMALAAVTAAGGKDYSDAQAKSRLWFDDNELSAKLIDEEYKTIWRSIEYSETRLNDVTRKAKSLLGIAQNPAAEHAPELAVNYETRPYEWAWCQYAGAIERGIDPALHIV